MNHTAPSCAAVRHRPSLAFAAFICTGLFSATAAIAQVAPQRPSGEPESLSAPAKAAAAPIAKAAGGATAVSTGTVHTCALVDGGVQCWGTNDFGQLGNPAAGAKSLVPVQTIPAGSNVTALSAGFRHTCAVISAGLQCWGYNALGQLGNNSLVSSPVPIQIFPANSKVTAVFAGSLHTCAVIDGGLQCWGDNDSGELGDGSRVRSPVPVQTIPAGSNVTSVSLGGGHNCATVNGGVRCWGVNGQGQLGNNNTTSTLAPVQATAAGNHVTTVTAGLDSTCVIVDGGLQCWGGNASGQLGNNSTAQSFVAVQTVPAGSNVVAVASGTVKTTCAAVNGGVQCWGDNSYGQLGNNSADAQSLVPVQAVAAGNNATAVSVGVFHACAVVNGQVKCWGRNVEGELGNGNNADSRVPVNALITTSFSAQGVWSGGASENGWGLALTQHGTTLVAGWYYYDANGKATWSIMPGCTWNAAFTNCSGALYNSTGAWFGNYDAAMFAQTNVGTLNFTFTNADTGTMQYTVNGVTGTKNISRLNFGTGTPPSAIDYTDVWWAGQSQNGWGVAMAQQQGVLAASWYSYDMQGKATWFLMNGGTWTNATTFTGNLLRATGSPLIGAVYDPSVFAPVTAGQITLVFSDANNATMTYTVDGVTQTKNISRLAF